MQLKNLRWCRTTDLECVNIPKSIMLFTRALVIRIISGDRSPIEIVIGSLLWDYRYTSRCVYSVCACGRTGAVSMTDFRRGPPIEKLARQWTVRSTGNKWSARNSTSRKKRRSIRSKRNGSPLRRTNDRLWLLSMEDNADRVDNCLSELDLRLNFAPNGHASMCSNLISKQRQNDNIAYFFYIT